MWAGCFYSGPYSGNFVQAAVQKQLVARVHKDQPFGRENIQERVGVGESEDGASRGIERSVRAFTIPPQ